MMPNKLIQILILLCAVVATMTTGCIEDGFTTSPSDQPLFSTDTLDMGTVYTDEQTSTYKLIVYNPHDKGLNLSNVVVSGTNASLFRLNVDGQSGVTFSDVEIRANDSIFVFVSADLPVNGTRQQRTIEANLDFHVNGMVSSIVLKADGQDINRIQGLTIQTDTLLTSDAVYQVKDSLVVAEGVTLSISPGTRLLFHDKARLVVRGTLISEGTPQEPVVITGDRTGNVITDVSFDLMSRQWSGIEFMPTSAGSHMQFTDVSNTSLGVRLFGDGKYTDDSAPMLTMVNSRLRNSGDYALYSEGASVEGYGCVFSDAAKGLVYLLGGKHRLEQCTFANYYLFAFPKGSSLTFVSPAEAGGSEAIYYGWDPVKAEVVNSISYGLAGDVTPGNLDGWDVYLRRCLFKAANGTDDYNFIDSLWDSDPLFYVDRSNYILDYRLKPESPAIDASYPDLNTYNLDMDFYGNPRANDLGAYSYVAPTE